MLTSIRKLCVQRRLYVSNVTIQISSMEFKKRAALGETAWGRKVNWKKIRPLNSEGPQNYSSNGSVKTLRMYSFYKNTLTFNCCFSNLSLFCFNWKDVAEPTSWQGGPGWPPMWSPLTRKILGHSLRRLRLLLLLICFPLHRSLRFHLGFAFNLKIMCLGGELSAW